MFQLGASVAIGAELEQVHGQLSAISRRVAQTVREAPRQDASGWDGLAAQAYQSQLDRLSRELEGAQELLRSATDLTAAALFEVRGHV